MPYHNLDELPDQIKAHLPQHAREIYMEAFNHAWDEYADPGKRRGDASREETAHKVAWAAVKQQYEKRNGNWARRKT